MARKPSTPRSTSSQRRLRRARHMQGGSVRQAKCGLGGCGVRVAGKALQLAAGRGAACCGGAGRAATGHSALPPAARRQPARGDLQPLGPTPAGCGCGCPGRPHPHRGSWNGLMRWRSRSGVVNSSRMRERVSTCSGSGGGGGAGGGWHRRLGGAAMMGSACGAALAAPAYAPLGRLLSVLTISNTPMPWPPAVHG